MTRGVALALACLLSCLPCLSFAREGTRPPLTNGNEEALIIGIAARSAELGAIGASAAHCGVTPIVETLESIRGFWPGAPDTTAIQLEVEWWFRGTDPARKQVLLFGPWTRQADYPQFREVPTRYVYVGELSQPSGTTASDQPYGDIDADGQWDVPVFRLVTRNAVETATYCQKVTAYFDQTQGDVWQTRVAIHCDDTNYGGGAWNQRARELSLDLASVVGGAFSPDPVILASEHTFDWNHEVLTSALSEGRAVIVAGPSTGSGPLDWLTFSPWGWSFEDAPANGRWPLMLGYSCEIGQFQVYSDPLDNFSPLCRDFTQLADYLKGPIALTGPTSGSHQYVNAWLAEAQLPVLLEFGMSFGQSLLHATNLVRYHHPEAAEALLAYAGFGVPWLKLTATTGSPSSLSDAFQPSRPRLRLSPNPVRMGGELSIRLSSPLAAQSGIVIDAAGRLVRKLSIPSSGVSRWKLRDDRGRAIGSGVYFLRIPGAEKSTQTVIVVR